MQTKGFRSAVRAPVAALAAALVAGCGGGIAPPSQYAVQSSPGAARAAARPGSLDPTFGQGGTAVFPIALSPVAAAVQRDGRIVVAGSVGSGPGQAAVVRLLPNGDLDPAFGTGGIAALNMWALYSLTLDPDGTILLGGIGPSGKHAELVRLKTGGTVDPSFGSGGSVQFDYVPDSSNAVLAVVDEPGGYILAGGFGLATSSDDYLTSLARFDASGAPDESFGTHGVVAMDLVGGVTALGLQSDDKILACGGFITGAKSLVVRFLADGALDRKDAGGTLVGVAHTGSLTFGGTNEFQLDGKLLQWKPVASKGGGHYVRVVRLLRDGKPDPTFQSVRFAFGSPSFGHADDLEIASNGSLLVGGQADASGYSGFGLARLEPSGPLDDGFGRKGRVVTAIGGGASVTALAVAPDGRIVAAGPVSSSGSNVELGVARYIAK